MRKLVPGSSPAFAASSLSVISSWSALNASISLNPLASDCTVLRSPAGEAVLRAALLPAPAALEEANGRFLFFRIAKNISQAVEDEYFAGPRLSTSRRVRRKARLKPLI